MSGQLFGTNSLGGFFSNPELSNKMRVVAQPIKRFRAFTSPLGAGGAHTSDKVFFDKVQNIATAGGPLVETNTIPESNFLIGQGTATMTEYGNSIPWTQKGQTLNQLNLDDAVTIALKNDAAKVLDSQCALQYKAAEFKLVCSLSNSTVITSNGTATATASSDLTASNVRDAVNFMRKKNIPFADGANYICIASVQSYSNMFGDSNTTGSGWVDISKYTAQFAQNLFSGEVGKYYSVRFVEETNVLSNSIGLGASHGEAVIFGDDAVKEVVAIPEELREKIPTDFGRSQGLAWYALLGFQRIWSFVADTEEHIVHVTSA